MAWTVILTVADHEQNGFASLARWQFPSEAAARAFIAAEDAAIPEGAEPAFGGDACAGEDENPHARLASAM